MNIHFALLIYNGEIYARNNPGIAIATYADLLNWNDERDDDYWERIYQHYHKNTRFDFQYDIIQTTTINELKRFIAEKIGFERDLFSKFPIGIYLKIEEELICIVDDEVTFATICKHYGVLDKFCVYFMLSNQAGDIWIEDGLRYYMHSREAGRHNKPHVHVDYRHEASASICIYDGNVLDGKLPSKALRKARERILGKQSYLLDCWNKMTDGLKVDINHYFGIIPLDENQ